MAWGRMGPNDADAQITPDVCAADDEIDTGEAANVQ